MTKEQKEVLFELVGVNLPFEFHHGDCVGADEQAHYVVREARNNKVIVHPPSDDKLRAYCQGDEIREEKEYLARNRDIVNETDELWAFPNGSDGASKKRPGGTWYTIRYARNEAHKKVTIVYANGSIDCLDN